MMATAPIETKEDRARNDAYNLVEFHRLKQTNTEIRKDKKRFAAAVAYIKKENEERAEALKKEIAARRAAVKQ